MWSGLRAVSFDLDDTLWAVGPVLLRAESALTGWLAERYPRLVALHEPEAARERRVAVTREFPDRAHDLTFVRTESLRQMAAEAGYGPGVAEEAFAVFHAARNAVEPYHDVPEALSRLASRFPLFALSNGNADVRRTPLAAHFQLGISPAEAGVAKPDSGIFEHLFRRTGLKPAEVLHVGDDPVTDVAGGRGAGCRTVWVNRRGVAWPAAHARADAEVSDLNQLVALLAHGGP